jgi:REP element-mobilizing transposase RayT
MHIEANQLYHIYNQGNNREKIFYTEKDYTLFMDYFKKSVHLFCKTLAWCLMPNHFHFLIYATEQSARLMKLGNISSTQLSNAFRVLQSSYAQHINYREKRKGALFRQKAKAKCLDEGNDQYALTAFHYIHQNPLKAGLVKDLEEWSYSSYIDYVDWCERSLCDKELAEQWVGFERGRIKDDTLQTLDEGIIQKIVY